MSNWLYEQRKIWANNQIQQRRRGLLSPERIQKLDSVGFDWNRVDTTVAKKAKLLEMARNGEPRPNQETPLGWSLGSYSSKSHGCYDPIFDKEIRELAPNWWEDTVAINQVKLLEMARNGETRPDKRSKDSVIAALGRALGNYNSPKGMKYYPDFNKQIREAAPQWYEDTVAINKTKLLEMACNGESRPPQRTPLGKALSRYTSNFVNNHMYDPVFNMKIRELAPQWLEGTATAKKDKLLELARNRESRPNKRSLDPLVAALGDALCRYTNKNQRCYDPIFDKEIRELAPHWFKDINYEEVQQETLPGRFESLEDPPSQLAS